jgi:hypothetical protein
MSHGAAPMRMADACRVHALLKRPNLMSVRRDSIYENFILEINLFLNNFELFFKRQQMVKVVFATRPKVFMWNISKRTVSKSLKTWLVACTSHLTFSFLRT